MINVGGFSLFIFSFQIIYTESFQAHSFTEALSIGLLYLSFRSIDVFDE